MEKFGKVFVIALVTYVIGYLKGVFTTARKAKDPDFFNTDIVE